MDYKIDKSFAFACWIKLVVLVGVLSACSTFSSKPDIDSEKYKQAVSDFYVSLAAIQSDQALFATEKMQALADTYPNESAAWANLSVYGMRRGNFELATTRMENALEQNGENANIQFLAGILESRKGNIESSIEHLRKAARLDSTNLKIRYALAEELEREDPEDNAERIEELLDQILKQDSNNLALLLEIVRVSAKWDNQPKLKQALQKLEKLSTEWPDQIQQQFQDHKTAILEKEGENISFELSFLRNNLTQLPRFQYDQRKIEFPSNQVGFLITEFLWLPNADHTAAPADSQLTFTPSEGAPAGNVELYKPVALANDQQASTISVSGDTARINEELTLDFPGNGDSGQLPPNTVTTLDYNYDFLNDIAFAGPGGFKFYEQQEDSSFKDVTQSLNLSSSILEAAYVGSWVNDFDLDGDLDLLLSAQNGEAFVLRNNGDGTFEVRKPFGDLQNVRDFLWADFDLDGDQDAVILTAGGKVHFYRNERAGEFIRDTSINIREPVKALDFGDLNADGVFEIVSWHPGQISSTSFSDSTGNWHTRSLVSFEESTDDKESLSQLFIADLDNNGALDVMISDQNNTRFWLSDEQVSLVSETYETKPFVYGVSDMDGDMRLDLLGLTAKNEVLKLNNNGSKEYNARIVSPRASGDSGDQRINSFGIGGEIESRSGLQYAKQPIDKPWVHLGLGTYEEAEMVRINWPNGTMQAEFAELGYDSKIQNEQILKGSCPWVQTHNGEEMEFVTDFLWRTALGLKINAQGEANVIHSIDWIKIESDQLKPRNGFYDVRITADLWETHFFDHVSLMAVDHPKGTEVFVDERFTLPAPEQKLYPMQEIYPLASATDQDGNDVTKTIAKEDGEYLNSFSLTPYQGLAEEHYVEVKLGDEVPRNEKLKLLAKGWVYPTDTSINIAISQGDYDPPHGIRVEVPDGKGGWKVAHENIGFPAGKNKMVLVDLEGVFEPDTERKVRLYTNMEIYWDQIRVGVQNDNIELNTEKLSADVANLRYRGYSKLVQKDRFLPTKSDYQQISGTTQKWRDLVGFYTRFGDVKELTKEIDDRYVIMNAGDELVFEFPALDPPKKGWERDFVLIGDGWVKDGDYNTGYSKTVLPLPYHGMEDYSEEPGSLEEDPVYKEHKEDWAKYHTRYVTPHNFNTALKFKK